MIRNLGHALIGGVLILGIGWLVAQPAVQKQISHGGHRAILGVLAALAIFVLVSVVKAFKKTKKDSKSGSSYAYSGSKK